MFIAPKRDTSLIPILPDNYTLWHKEIVNENKRYFFFEWFQGKSEIL